ncbi:hypothetical protein [Streptomyces sp. R08]|uniref:Uncharacterized protein n=1 Tax=Streptomyces sp. R08 TaxID=3238624 RepID=A0AB39MNR6_9ACTN
MRDGESTVVKFAYVRKHPPFEDPTETSVKYHAEPNKLEHVEGDKRGAPKNDSETFTLA